jgi:hypothetical protein
MAKRRQGKKSAGKPKTYFASPERSSRDELQAEVATASRNPVIDAVMRNFGGLIAVLNEHRQILTLNHALLEALGIGDAAKALGLRPGEAAGCVYASDGPGGCGTGRYCSNCGAAISIVTAQDTGKPTERDCALSVRQGRKAMDIDFQVRCMPVDVAGQRLLLLFLRDVSDDRRRGALERMFFHDVANLLTSLCVAGDIMAGLHEDDALVQGLRQGLDLLSREVEIQRALAEAGDRMKPPPKVATSTRWVLTKIRTLFATHPAAAGKILAASRTDLPLQTNPDLLVRALVSLVTNALESTPRGGRVKVWAEKERGGVAILVWNRDAMPEDAARRVFQRYFTTKPGPGRGLGTFTAKWLTEEFLGGRIGFESTPADGTTFRILLPAKA